MMKTKIIPAMGALMMMSGAAYSADLYTPMPEPAPVYTGGWYFGAFGGANWLNKTSFDVDLAGLANVRNKYKTGYVVGGAFGYDFDRAMGPLGVRLEGELSYRRNGIDSHSIGGAVQPGSFGSTTAFAGMANLLFDIETGSPFSFYGGGGIGGAEVKFKNHGVAGPVTVVNDSSTKFAWQAIAGLGYEIAPGWTFDVQYRYFNVGDVSLTSNTGPSSKTSYKSHAVLGGIRWSF